MPEKCALSHGSGVLGRDPRDSCRFWSPHVENVCTVTQIRLGEGGGWLRKTRSIWKLRFGKYLHSKWLSSLF